MMNSHESSQHRPSEFECPSCEGARATISNGKEQFLYGAGDEQVTLTALVDVLSCPDCEEQFTAGDAEKARHAAVCQHLNRLTPSQVREIRKQYCLSQEEFARKTGFGLASVKRWESGSQIQNQSSDNLLRLLSVKANMALISRENKTRNVLHSENRFRTEVRPEAIERARAFALRRLPTETTAA